MSVSVWYMFRVRAGEEGNNAKILELPIRESNRTPAITIAVFLGHLTFPPSPQPPSSLEVCCSQIAYVCNIRNFVGV